MNDYYLYKGEPIPPQSDEERKLRSKGLILNHAEYPVSPDGAYPVESHRIEIVDFSNGTAKVLTDMGDSYEYSINEYSINLQHINNNINNNE
jgi:hypothetical protein